MRRTLFGLAWLTTAISAGLAVPACSSSGGSKSIPTEVEGPNSGGGVGIACADATPCRPGLVCNGGTCATGHSSTDGAACLLNDECQTASYCTAAHTCGPRGSGSSAGGSGGSGTSGGALGDVSAPCASDGDCLGGLRCALSGLSAVCQKQGAGDAGATCTSAADCLGGLTCLSNVCGQGTMGVPPFGVSLWPGETCGADDPTPTAYFRVPRGSDDGDFYRLPFPNDIRTRGGHPDYTGHPTPGADLLGYDAVSRYLRAIEAGADGFGAYPTVYFRFSSVLDLDAFRTPGVISYVDITPGAPELGNGRGLGWLNYAGRSKYICSNFLAVRPAEGDPLTPGHTYAVIVTKGGTSGGAPIAQAPDFTAMLAGSAPGDAALTAAYPAYAPLRAYLASKSMDPSSILTAAVFTVGHVRSPAEKLAAAAAAAPPPTTSSWIKCGSGPSPCKDATGDRACGGNDPAFDELQALVSLPIYQQGTAPYLDPEDGGNIDASGATVTPVRTEQVCMALTVPKGSAPAGGWPVVVYAHGTGGSYRSHINEGVAKMLATASTPMAVLGIDQVQHGPRRGDSTMSPNNLFFNFGNPSAAQGNPLQGAADQLALGRLAATFSLPAASSPTGADLAFDPGAVLFWGHSQGATEGGIAVPYSNDIKGAVFSGEGASLMDALLTKTQPVNIAGALAFALVDSDPAHPTQLAFANFNPVLSALQSYIDVADPLHFGALVTDQAPAGVTPHHVFQPFGMGDSYSPPVTEATYATAAHLDLVGALLSTTQSTSPVDCKPDATGACTLPGGAASLSGNKMVMVGMQTVPFTAAVRQYQPDATYDGHFVSTKNATASADVVRFLAGLAAHQTPAVGP